MYLNTQWTGMKMRGCHSLVTKKKQRHKMKHMKLHWNTKQQFCTVRVIKHWPRWPREVKRFPSEQIFTLCLDTDLGSFL